MFLGYKREKVTNLLRISIEDMMQNFILTEVSAVFKIKMIRSWNDEEDWTWKIPILSSQNTMFPLSVITFCKVISHIERNSPFLLFSKLPHTFWWQKTKNLKFQEFNHNDQKLIKWDNNSIGLQLIQKQSSCSETYYIDKVLKNGTVWMLNVK